MTEIHDDEIDNYDGLTKKDFQDLARHCIRQFFKNKVDEHGFEIDIEELLTDRNISLVLNLSVCDGMPLIYTALKQKETHNKRKSKVSEDVELVLKLLNECSKMSLPKPCAAGLIVIYTEVCKGCKLEI